MAVLKIRTFKGEGISPETTVTIPLKILKFARKLIPSSAADAMREKGVDIDTILDLSSNPEAHGTIFEFEEHKKHERVEITIEEAS
jgi:hypothetical protein